MTRYLLLALLLTSSSAAAQSAWRLVQTTDELTAAKKIDPGLAVIMTTGFGTTQSAIEAMLFAVANGDNLAT